MIWVRNIVVEGGCWVQLDVELGIVDANHCPASLEVVFEIGFG